ncbi:MAG: winged helix-turn-helix domain-containing protein [Methanomicrobiales archaeon]|nr:winged helix-turn-helix domain-containing protein [Methanomicrobiales archaeon]
MLLRRLFTSGTRVNLLTLFLLDPERERYPREMERDTGENINAVRRELRNLEELGLVTSASRGRQRWYAVNRAFFLYPELSAMVQKTRGLIPLIRRHLEGVGGIGYAFLYGPSAREGGLWSGDLNLFAMGDADPALVATEIREMERRLGREIHTLLLTPLAFRDRLGNRDPALRNLMEGPKVVIIPLR